MNNSELWICPLLKCLQHGADRYYLSGTLVPAARQVVFCHPGLHLTSLRFLYRHCFRLRLLRLARHRHLGCIILHASTRRPKEQEYDKSDARRTKINSALSLKMELPCISFKERNSSVNIPELKLEGKRINITPCLWAHYLCNSRWVRQRIVTIFFSSRHLIQKCVVRIRTSIKFRCSNA